MRKFLAISILSILLPSFAPATAAGASLSVGVSKKSVSVGQTFTATIYVNSGGQDINAIGADVTYSSDILQATNVAGPSVITLYVSKGVVRDGLVSIQGGIQPAKSFAGSSVGTITFRAKKEGTASIAIASSSGVYAADGQGTNILAGRGSASVTVGPATNTNTNTPTPPPPPSATLQVTSTTHAVPGTYYNSNRIEANWAMQGADAYAYAFDQNPTTEPDITKPTTDSNAIFFADHDGVWYLHVRARVAGKWGATVHRQFLVDRTAPENLMLNIAPALTVDAGEKLKITFSATDATSGIDKFEIAFTPQGEAPLFEAAVSPVERKDLAPGIYAVSVRATDKAGNSTEQSKTVNVLGPEAPPPPFWQVWYIDLIGGAAVGAILILFFLRLFGGKRRKRRR